MSRLREKGLRAALSALIAWLLALGLGLPLLRGLGLNGQMLRYACCTTGLALLLALLRTRKYLLPLSLLLFAAAAGVHYLLGGGWLQDALNAGNAIVLHLRGAGVALPLYGDTIAIQLALYASLLGAMLALPDNGRAFISTLMGIEMMKKSQRFWRNGAGKSNGLVAIPKWTSLLA